VQLTRCHEFWQARAAIAEQYQQGFEDLPELVRPVELPDRLHAWHLYVIQLVTERLRIGRDEFLERLRHAGIGASVHFIPLHLHPFYQRLGWSPEQFPVATNAFTRILSLPIFPGMTPQDVSRVIEAVRTIVTECRR
jgi:perosamine synthetase